MQPWTSATSTLPIAKDDDPLLIFRQFFQRTHLKLLVKQEKVLKNK